MAAMVAFLWLSVLLLNADFVANNEEQCMVTLIVNMALQLQEQSDKLERQATQLEQQSAQLRSLQDQINSTDAANVAGQKELQISQQYSADKLGRIVDTVKSLEADLKENAANLTQLSNACSKQDEMVQLLSESVQDKARAMENSLEWIRGSLTALSETDSKQDRILQQQSGQLPRLQDKMDSMETDLQWITGNLTALNEIDVKAQVGFMAKVGREHIGGSNAILKFDSVQYNKGGAYSAGTGIFTAPVAGMYSFFIKTEVKYGQFMRMGLMKEGSRVLYLYGNDPDSYQTPSGQVVLHLAQGERVWVVTPPGNINTVRTFTRFGGFLVHPDA